MQVNLSSGNYNIIDSGQVFLFHPDEDLRIEIVVNKDFELSIVMQFVEDASSEQRIDTEMSGNTMRLCCINFIDKGTGLGFPVKIGIIEGKELFMTFWAYLEGKDEQPGKARSVKYTLFLEK